MPISEISTNGIKAKVSRMLEEVHVIVSVEERLDVKKLFSTMLGEVLVIVWVEERVDSISTVEERLDSISTVDGSVGNVLCGIRKKLWRTVFCTSKSILISLASTNGI